MIPQEIKDKIDTYSIDKSCSPSDADFIAGYVQYGYSLAAEQYILFNQKSLSLNDLLSVWGGDWINSPLFNNFKELAKTKQI